MLLVISFMLVFMIGTSISTPDTFWLDEDHGVLSFVYLRAKDLVEDDQSLESFMNLVVEFCAQVGGGQNAIRRKFSYCLLIVLFHAGVLVKS
ncbi:uncharacterized protein BX664DRAFT_344487 [Halteromyces radiatus]|uniref:uncharacterized protein n=1 Tax=Halteromyces radiatus TaxID=101107 RepID=UPI0022208B2E|nr:uncharacterized protein BX664DRAFT_344487 [Halteromyces radiatus]KAI8076371.1 hypothetical protein BX664DRAFT_344487 [Halteromyces radiatus]